MLMLTTQHKAVLVDEVVSLLQAGRGGSFLDCTMGGGGHVRALLEANNDNTVIAADRDWRAIERGSALLTEFAPRLELMHAPFSQYARLLAGKRFDGILADLGLSTDQLRERRGFSFNDAGPLDMRMDERQEYSALNLVNESGRADLTKALRRGGVGGEAASVAAAIIKARPLKDTQELAQVIGEALRGRHREKKGNPATVIFQALRIAVNREFEELEALLDSAPQMAKPSARLVIISFHSLEDKIAANKMRGWAASGTYPAMWRGAREEKSLGRLLSRKAVIPAAEEVRNNPAARSARLRVFQFN